MPLEEVGLEGSGVVVWRRGVGELGGLAEDALYGGGFCVELAMCRHRGVCLADSRTTSPVMRRYRPITTNGE